MRPLFTLLAAGLFLAPVAVRAQTAAEQEAGDTAALDRDVGPLKDRIPPVTGHVFLMEKRWELSPSVALSFRDAFFTKYSLGGTLTYHFTETFGVALRGGYSLVSASGASQICTINVTGTTGVRGCKDPTVSDLDGRAPGQLKILASLDAQWTPLYGKISLFAEKVIHFNMYVTAGPMAVQYLGPNDDGTPGSTAKWTPGADVGLGMRFFMTRWLTLRVELRDAIYNEKTSTVGRENQLRNQLFVDLGLSFFFPTTFHEG